MAKKLTSARTKPSDGRPSGPATVHQRAAKLPKPSGPGKPVQNVGQSLLSAMMSNPATAKAVRDAFTLRVD